MTKQESTPLSIDSFDTFPSLLPNRCLRSGLGGGSPNPLARDQGQAAWRDNQRLAEETYKKALAVDPTNAKTYLGLGQLYDRTLSTS